MSEEYSEVTSQGWFGRITESIKGIAIGLLMFVVAFPLLWWNEGRAVLDYRANQEGAASVVAVAADSADPAHEGKLVHISGEAKTDETLKDNVFGVSANAIKLVRLVEMFQWEEESEKETRKKLGGGTETVTTYRYDKVWSERVIDSTDFRQPDAPRNPTSMAHQSQTWQAQDVTVGAYNLNTGLIEQIKGAEPLPVSDRNLTGLGGLSARALIEGHRIFIGQEGKPNPAAPVIGDLRITFQQVPRQMVSIVAKQVGASFEPYIPEATGGKRQIQYLEMGQMSADDMFEAAQKRSEMMTWLLRLGGFLLMAVGIGLVLRPLSVLGDVVPLLGNLVGMVTGLVAVLVALAFSLLVISVAWVAHRPLIGIPLLIVAIAAIAGAIVVTARQREA